ncbi:MAG: Unknown protein [uncultured Sulfurovum sp.]|uniref:HPt domain-containing protein n=1 Tax=uncultured Sulfurovum sp. TaxID=269237 RepID=A0A6S6TAF3_9BACT|nr:MAG: Unknown protein [uncultured Sulfurovum sp.]
MYYIIINHTKQIIAADNSFLQAIHANTLENLNRQLILETITLDNNNNNELSVKTSKDVLNFKSVSTPLSSILGDLTLINVSNIDSLNRDIPSDTIETELELFDLTIPKTPKHNIDKIESPESVDISFNEPSAPMELFEETTLETDKHTPIYIDIDKVSEEIGISNSDYNNFLSEYIDTAISLESDLNSNNQEKQSTASQTLMQLADVLQLPVVNSIIGKLNTTDKESAMNLIKKFYDTLSMLTTKKQLSEHIQPQDIVKPVSFQIDDLQLLDDIDTQDSPRENPRKNSVETTQKTNLSPDIDLLIDDPLPETNQYDTKPIEEVSTKNKPVTRNDNTLDTSTTKSFGTLNLDEVKPMPFEFNMSDAADDLSLPLDLIEEFVKDFIVQARTETKKMVESYENGDLESIQKIGHLLKGASSNLRIEPLSNSLYDIQFCENSTKLENLIYIYWGQFLAFEQQINNSK